ncbi:MULTISPECIES: A24 family peptidase [unclassified Streptomyces]|uniref:prepilin peptidase n=1 Tax=unclassified Streptomyces TaxID=2593676 RepID=UPI000978FA15|nr:MULTISPECIES: A24 family peptidase [unclassified Streptomyces]ONI55357.1 Type 4 prepilin-like proteins leader peptide-processing enzyme [Streptomyces sp. IB2014 011-1]RDV53675.1 prepilin peptidase [Streptomyces sp. IB2014 011-12]
MDLVLLAVAAVWGGATGLLIPRAAYRFAVQPEEPWRTACPAGHTFTGPFGGWWGPARCTPCASRAPRAQAPVRYGDEAEAPVACGEETEAPAPLPYAYAPGALAPLITVLACVTLAAATGPRPELAAWLLLAPPAVLLATVDRRVHRLPDPLTLPLAAAAVLLLGGAALLPGHAGSWASGLLGGLVLGGFYLLLFLINPNGMGFGDVKLALALGVALGWYGWEVLFLGGFAGFLFGAAYGLGLVLLRRAGRKTGIPFGPFMIAGALVGVLLGALAA